MLVVHCDHCSAEGPESPGGLEAERRAQVEGWVVTRDRRHFCPQDAHWATGVPSTARYSNRPGPQDFPSIVEYTAWLVAHPLDGTQTTP